MKDIKFLDCTLRDGAHVVSGNFKKNCITSLLKKLALSGTEIVEFGFLKNGSYDADKVYYPHIEDAYKILDEAEVRNSRSCIYALMARADEYDINELPPADGTIQLLRVAFYYDYLEGGFDFVHKAMQLGYHCSVNLINTPGSSVDELRAFIEKVNEAAPFAVSIVDTFGVLGLSELEDIVRLYDKNLEPGIRIGLHVHENLSLAFAMGQHFLKITGEDRNVMIDGSLMGIGRAPGNLCTELMIEFMNKNYGKHYDTCAVMAAINDDIKPFKKSFQWGYAPEYMLSAKHRVHRSYAEFLEQGGISLDNADLLLSEIDAVHAKKYDRRYIEELAVERGLL